MTPFEVDGILYVEPAESRLVFGRSPGGLPSWWVNRKERGALTTEELFRVLAVEAPNEASAQAQHGRS